MDSQKEQYLAKILYLRNNLTLLNNSFELNQAHYKELFDEQADLFGLVLAPNNRGRDDFEMRLSTLRGNVVNLATSVGVNLQPFQPRGFANALATQPQQFPSAYGRPPQPHFSPPQGSPAEGDIGQHLGEELSYLANVPQNSPARRQEQGVDMASRRGDVESQLNPGALESDEPREAVTPRRSSTSSGHQTRSIQPRSNTRSNTTQRQRQPNFENQPPDGSQSRRRWQTEEGGAGPVRRVSISSLRKTPYPLNPPSFSQATPNLVQQRYPHYPHYRPAAPALSQAPQNPRHQPYPPHPHYRILAPPFPLAPQNPMPQAQQQQRRASITLLTTGEAQLPLPIQYPQQTPREQVTRHWDGVLNNIAGGLVMRGENAAGAVRRLALYDRHYPRDRASAMAPPALLTAIQRDQHRGASQPEGVSEAENEFFAPMSPSPSPYEQDRNGTLSGPSAPPPSGPYDCPARNAPLPGLMAPQMSGNYDASIYDAPSPGPGPLALPSSGLFDYPTHSAPSVRLPALAPYSSEPFDASIYDASPPDNAVVSSPIRGGDLQPALAPATSSVATLTPADRHAASYHFTGTPDWRGQVRLQQQQQQRQQATADAAAAATIAAVQAVASPSNAVPAQRAETETENWDASAFEYDGDGRTEPN